jgi:enamine deaminase RidA (YjgF/YER057c/UK114 family)
MRLVFIAGQTPTDAQYQVRYRAQDRQVRENLDVQLKAAGATWGDVVYGRVFTLDVDALIAALRADAGAGYWFADSTLPGPAEDRKSPSRSRSLT